MTTTTPRLAPCARLEEGLGAGGEQVVAPVLQPDGTLAAGAICPFDDDVVLEGLRLMTYSRLVDERGVSFQRQGRIGTFAEARGQEGASAGSALALDPLTDWVVQSYREFPALRRQGVSMLNHWLTYIGHPKGWALPGAVKVFPMQIELAAQLPQAVGMAWGLRLQGDPGIAIAYFGDGASSEGDFYEAGNLAGLTRAPVILFCQNNGWAISTPRGRQSGAVSIAAKAAAFGIPGYVVDGNDVMAVYAVTAEAAARARSGGGPTLIEAQTYRVAAHNTSDDPSRYCPPGDLEDWNARDPLHRLRTFAIDQGLWDQARDEQFRAESLAEIDEAFDQAEAAAREFTPAMLFDHVYSTPPAHLAAQQATIEREIG